MRPAADGGTGDGAGRKLDDAATDPVPTGSVQGQGRDAALDAATLARCGYVSCSCPDDWREETPERTARCPEHGTAEARARWFADQRKRTATIVDAYLALAGSSLVSGEPGNACPECGSPADSPSGGRLCVCDGPPPPPGAYRMGEPGQAKGSEYR